ncbi:MAG: alpha/beta hydrolase [Bacteroidetes bacterium]|nr:MAG: alpha/beta hydrolase [Bacteroidota bacterium]TAG85476.1 MAG: alpha/beta hydrolase [Bacteroidota bacterium]
MKKLVIKIISSIFPNQVASFAYKQLTNPQITKLRSNELVVLDKSEKEILKFQDFDIQLYTWKGGSDKVLLIHGWEGQAGNFADIIEKLIEQNYTVYAFDAPSHGFSSKGKTSLFEFTELVAILIRKYGVTKLISHSFGGVATTYALFNNQDIKINKYLLLTVPDKFIERINDVVEQVGVTEKVKNKLISRLEKETKLNINDLNVSDFVKVIDVKQSLIIHDAKDTVIPIKRAKNVFNQWKNSQFLEIEGTGHFRILRTESVIEKTLEFLKD